MLLLATARHSLLTTYELPMSSCPQPNHLILLSPAPMLSMDEKSWLMYCLLSMPLKESVWFLYPRMMALVRKWVWSEGWLVGYIVSGF